MMVEKSELEQQLRGMTVELYAEKTIGGAVTGVHSGLFAGFFCAGLLPIQIYEHANTPRDQLETIIGANQHSARLPREAYEKLIEVVVGYPTALAVAVATIKSGITDRHLNEFGYTLLVSNALAAAGVIYKKFLTARKSNPLSDSDIARGQHTYNLVNVRQF